MSSFVCKEILSLLIQQTLIRKIVQIQHSMNNPFPNLNLFTARNVNNANRKIKKSNCSVVFLH